MKIKTPSHVHGTSRTLGCHGLWSSPQTGATTGARESLELC
jgi:hypothetical protein